MNTDMSSLSAVLGAWGIVPAGPLEALQPEATFRVRVENGPDLILTRIGPLDARTADWAALQHDVRRHLARAGVPVAVPRPDGQGRVAVPAEGYLYTLQPRLPGRQGSSRPEDCDPLYRNYGAAIARMYRALATFPPEALAGRVMREDLEPWVFEGEIPRIAQYLSGAQEARFRAMVADVGEEMRAACRDLPEQLLHRDCHAGNLLSCGKRVTGIIDWDNLRIGARIYDLAYFAAQLAKRHVGDPGTMERWLHDITLVLQSYDRVNPLAEKEKAAFPYVVIAQLITFAGWVVETEWFVGLQTELDAMAWMHTNLREVQDRVIAAWGESG
jgi:Ser/Thr protein kinase RdoA (MazF antagonist)